MRVTALTAPTHALDTIARSLRQGYVHPTTVINTLIETENAGGLSAVEQLKGQLELSLSALQDRQHPHTALAQAWLRATADYLRLFHRAV